MNFLNNLLIIKNQFLKKENFFYIIAILVIFFFDRVTKSKIINNFNENTFYVNDFINFDLIWNTGIGFGLLSSNSNLFYNSVTTVIGLVILYLLIFAINSNRFEKFIITVIISGALGNFYDRLYFKAVPDFIDLHYKSFHWFTFNIADMFITIGLIALIIYGSLKQNNEKI